MIDEAHGLYSPTGYCYAREAVEALVGHITEKEFKGNLLVIMSGYTDELNQMFARSNPGLRSRFDKIRVVFPAWTGKQAAVAVIAAVEAEGKKLTTGAELELKRSFDYMAQLPSWASARDVFEKIIPAMYAHRAARLALKKSHGILATSESPISVKLTSHEQRDSSSKQDFNYSRLCLPSNVSCAAQHLIIPYDITDVKEAFKHVQFDDNSVLALNSDTELHAAINSAKVARRLVVVLVCRDTNSFELSAGIVQAFEDLSYHFTGSNVLFAKLKVKSDEYRDCAGICSNEVEHVIPILTDTTFICFFGGVQVHRQTETHVLSLKQFIASFLAKATLPNSFKVCTQF